MLDDNLTKATFFLYLLLFCTCIPTDKSSDILYKYSIYDSLLQEVKKDAFSITYRPISDSVYTVILNGKFHDEQTSTYNNREIYHLKFDKNGIYTTCKDSFVLTYPFMLGMDSELIDEQKKCDRDLPFRHSHVTLAQQKIYGNDITIFSYSEMSGEDNGQVSYYIKDFGFLCYEYSAERNFLLCRKSHNTNLPDSILRIIGDSLIHDSLFFSRHVIAKNRISE